ncbi:hypothetical protein LCGC14_1163870 [marine sediment metagenome]|uniref:Uncharacterized protein n=1 Tax=marine sediment metagenome TaxID=412755 RepID=A0A0F9PA33_9ZZZZ
MRQKIENTLLFVCISIGLAMAMALLWATGCVR